MNENNKNSKIKFLSPEELKKAKEQSSLIGNFGYKIIFLPVIGLFYTIESYKLGLENFLLVAVFVVLSIFFLLKPTNKDEKVSTWKGEVNYWVYSHGSPSYVDNPTPVFLVKFLLWIIFLSPLA